MLLVLKFLHCTPSYGKVLLLTKSNGIIVMKKHVELKHNTLIKKFCPKNFDVATTITLSCEPTKKRAHVIPSVISSFFSFTNQFNKIMKPRFVS